MKTRLTILHAGLCAGLAAVIGCARPVLGPVHIADTASSAPSPDSWAWARCLQATVRDGLVDYARLSGQPDLLDAVLRELAAGPEPNDTGPMRTVRLINTYNALAMRAGLERYLATGGDARKARAPREDEYLFRLHGAMVTLVDVRNRLLSGPERDVRILFALCPATLETRLADRPFQADVLDRQLTATAAQAMNTPDTVRVDHENQTLWVADRIGRYETELIRWYERGTGAKGARLLDALLDLADDDGRRTLNTAVGYAVGVRRAERRLNLYTPPAR